MSMIKRDADRAASILIQKLGPDALIYTALRLDEMYEARDPEGQAVWTRVHEAAQYRLKRHGVEQGREHSDTRQPPVAGRNSKHPCSQTSTRNL